MAKKLSDCEKFREELNEIRGKRGGKPQEPVEFKLYMDLCEIFGGVEKLIESQSIFFNEIKAPNKHIIALVLNTYWFDNYDLAGCLAPTHEEQGIDEKSGLVNISKYQVFAFYRYSYLPQQMDITLTRNWETERGSICIQTSYPKGPATLAEKVEMVFRTPVEQEGEIPPNRGREVQDYFRIDPFAVTQSINRYQFEEYEMLYRVIQWHYCSKEWRLDEKQKEGSRVFTDRNDKKRQLRCTHQLNMARCYILGEVLTDKALRK